MNPSLQLKRPASWLRGLCETGATLTWAPNFGFALATERARDAELDGFRLDGCGDRCLMPRLQDFRDGDRAASLLSTK